MAFSLPGWTSTRVHRALLFAGISGCLGTEAMAVPLTAGMKVGIDFGPTLTAKWNNITTNNQTIAAGAVVNLTDVVVDGVSIETTNGQFVNNDGTDNWAGLAVNGGQAPPEFVDSVVTDIAGNFSLVPDDTPYKVTIRGLDPELAFRVVAVSTAPGGQIDTYKLTGAAVYGPSAISRNSARAQGLVHTFTEVRPDAAGKLVIEVTDTSAGKNPVTNGILLSASLPGNPDSDEDGLLDAWEQEHFNGLGQSADGDYDGDGDTNATEQANGTDPADIASHSTALKVWQIDFQGGTGGALGSADPVTATTDIGNGPKWNAFEIPATNGDVFANPPTNHNAAIDPVLADLADAAGQASNVTLTIDGGVSGFNVGRILTMGGINHAFGDHWFWGAQGRTTATVNFTFSHLPPGTYSLTAYANPDQHNPPRDFGLVVGSVTRPIRPVFSNGFYADTGTFSGTVAGISVDGGGTLSGALTTIGGDPSIGAMVLRRMETPTSAFSSNDTAIVNRGGQVRVPVLANDVSFPPVASVEIVSPPAAGSAVVQPDGAVLYTHAGGAGASDTFSYRFTDSTGVSAVAQVSVAVEDGRVAPASITLPLTPPQTSYAFEDAFKDRGAFNFGTPTWMTTIPGNSKRFFVSERTGVIWEITDMSAANPTRRMFADLSAHLDLFTEMGVKSFAFHPAFESGNPYLYVTYNYEDSPSSDVGTVRLSRFTVMDEGAGTVDPDSEVILFEVDSRSQDHNLDSCRFGPDGYLYIGSGDERRPGENSQTISNMFWSSVIRIDVDRKAENLEPNPPGNPSLVIFTDGGVARYKVPVDNPYAATSGSVTYNGNAVPWNTARSEIYITGVRNPWQFTFDTVDGEPVLWLGDVGSDGGESREEVNIFRKGDNGGWNHVEGDRYNSTPPAGTVIHAPEYFYARGSGSYQGASVTGGFVYHGTRYPDLEGKYLFGDWLSGHVWTLERGTVSPNPSVNRITGLSGVVGFATDPSNGDILALSWNSQRGALFDQSGQIGKVFRLKASVTSGSAFPATLAETGLFADPVALTPNPGLHFYEPNVTFWSDHAVKSRWFAVPGTQEKIGWVPEGAFTFPTGTLWVKHFEMEMTRGNPSTRKRLETRVIMKNADGVYGISYRWNEAGTEATLVGDGGASFDLNITDPSRPAGDQLIVQRWQIPSRAQCLTCHNPSSGQVLGFDSRQLNRDDIPFEGGTGNFLQRMADAGYLEGLQGDPHELPRHVPLGDPEADLETKVRSYLAVNCAYCHADANGGMDLRAHVPLADMRLLHRPDQGQIVIVDPLLRRIVPGSPQHSSLLQRVAGAAGFNRMPPLSSAVVDDAGVAMLTDWIQNAANSAPVFSVEAGDPVFVVPAGALPGTVVADLTAVDPDAPRDTVTHRIESGNTAGLFALDPVTGRLTVNGDLAAAGEGLISLVISATDDFAANPKSSSLNVFIDPSGVNDPPRFTSPLHYYVPASLVAGTRVGRVTASDPERSPVTLASGGGTAAGAFLFDPATGTLTRGANALTAGAALSLEVTATDANNPPASVTATIVFHIVAGESASDAPAAGRTFWNLDLQGDGSNTAAGQVTNPVTTTRGGMTWNAFQVKAYSGNPSAMSANPSMTLATHQGTASPVGFHIFTDDDPTTAIGSGVYGYSGRAGLDSLTGDYLLLMNSSGANGPLLHEWEVTGLTPGWQYDLLMQGGYDGSTTRGIAFTVDLDGDGDLSDEAPVYLQANADAVVNSTVIRGVIADRNGRILGRSSRTPPPGQTWGESNWAGMQIRSGQNNPPAFTGNGPFAIPENSPAGSAVGTIVAHDPEGSVVTYALLEGGDRFSIDPATGAITSTAPLDYEASPTRLLTVSATDASGAVSWATVIVQVGNLPDTNGERVAAWLAGLGVPFSGSTDPAVHGFAADPDHDGVANAFERLFGGDPARPDSPLRLKVWVGQGDGTFTLNLDADVVAAVADVLRFKAEVSDDCVHWSPLGGEPVVISEEEGRRVLRYTDPGNRHFIRLRMDEADAR